MKVLAFGEILFDIIEGDKFLGGAPLNFAAHLSKLGADAYIVSAVGADNLGEIAIQQVKNTRVNTSFIQIDPEHETGTVLVALNDGQPAYTISENVAFDFIKSITSENLNKKFDFDFIYYGTLAQRNEQSRNTLREILKNKDFKQVFYDVNLRKSFFTKEILFQSLQHCSILKLNDEEVDILGDLLFGEALSLEDFGFRIALKFDIKIVIITAGAKGCIVYDNGNLHFVKGYPAKVVDTIGAGDSFSAAFLYHYYHNGDALAAADKANQLGAFVASSRGPIPEYSKEIIKAMEWLV